GGHTTSDRYWSADVYSSQLAGVHGRGARPVRQLARGRDREHDLLDHPERLLHGGELYGDHSRGTHRDGDEEREDGDRVPAGERQIGRASCRESVCMTAGAGG